MLDHGQRAANLVDQVECQTDDERAQLDSDSGGEVRIWSDCDDTPRIYVSALIGDADVTVFVLGLVTARQEAAMIVETLMSLEINGTPLA